MYGRMDSKRRGFMRRLEMENLMIQWVEEAGTFRGDKEAPRLALIFYKEPEVLEIVKYEIQEPIREE